MSARTSGWGGVVLAALTLGGCGYVEGLWGEDLEPKPIAAPAPPPGFRALFNGTDLTGWEGLGANPQERAEKSAEEVAAMEAGADLAMRKHWRAVSGCIYFDGHGYQNLRTVEEFGDFELLVDWRIPPGGDSGIYLRGCPQVQIWDVPAGSGGLYNDREHPSGPLVRADRAPGEWNTFRIVMVGERVTVWLNGVMVVRETPMESYWVEGAMVPGRGAIELQAHGGPLLFRNVYIRELNDHASGAAMR